MLKKILNFLWVVRVYAPDCARDHIERLVYFRNVRRAFDRKLPALTFLHLAGLRSLPSDQFSKNAPQRHERSGDHERPVQSTAIKL